MRKLILSLLVAFAATIHAAEDNFKAGPLAFDKPAAFKSITLPPGGMRVAQLEYAGAAGKAEVIFFFFGAGQGGGAQANVDRWLASFQEPKDKLNSKTEKKKTDAGEITYVEAEGTYMSGMPGGPKTPQPNSKLHGAILESPKGSLFIRMTGPLATVKAADADFRKMIESAK